MADKGLKRERGEPILYYAARLVLLEHDNLVDSTSPAILRRLDAIARELREIEDML
jgi:hypothetical protein